MASKAEGLVQVTDLGTIMLYGISVDGYHPSSKVRIVTHIHSDHIRGLTQSVRHSLFIGGTPLTLDLLEAMGYHIPLAKKLPLGYGVRVLFEDVVVSLHRTRHIPGSASVVVEADGLRVGYTSDFKLPGTTILKDLDVLVVDATYGFPEQVRPWQNEIEYLLADLIMEQLRLGNPVTIYAYNGKIEEVMQVLREHGIDAPYLVTAKHARLLAVLARHGVKLGDVVVEGSPEALDVERSRWYVRFRHYNSWWGKNSDGGVHLLLTGREFRKPYRWLSRRRAVVSFSDHADFRQLVEYITEAKPKFVIVDAYRGGEAARVFALYLRRKLDIPAVAQPA